MQKEIESNIETSQRSLEELIKIENKESENLIEIEQKIDKIAEDFIEAIKLVSFYNMDLMEIQFFKSGFVSITEVGRIHFMFLESSQTVLCHYILNMATFFFNPICSISFSPSPNHLQSPVLFF